MAAYDQGTRDQAQRALSPDHYGDDARYAAEKENLFLKSWRLVGHENMLPDNGDFITDELAGAPILLVRGEDGEIRGFYNICPHRAGPLATENTGNCGKELTCRYHGWRFALDGRLRSARDFGQSGGFDPRDLGLSQIELETWRGFLFARRAAGGASVANLVAPVTANWPEQEIPPFALRRSHEIACDWKIYVENYLEGYHVPTLHPSLDAEIISADYHVEMRDNVAIHSAPSRDDAVYSGFWGWVFPWLGINIYQHGLMMERMTPISANRTRLDYLYFFAPDREDDLQAMLELSDQVTAEDVRISEIVHRNVVSGAYAAGPLSPRHEGAVAWFQAQIRKLTPPVSP